MKLFITDYDGTLFVEEKAFKENIRALKTLQESNIKIVISTGRSYPSIKNQVNINQIPYDYLSCADGSVIYDNNGNILNMFQMDKEIIKPFQNFYQDLNYEEIQFVYKEGYSNILNESSQLLGINICLKTENYNQEIVDKFNKMAKFFPKYNFLNYMHPNFSYLCVKPKGITKATAIGFLMKKNNLCKNDLYVIGDSYNDYEMINEFQGVCMETSCDEVLKIAKKRYTNVSDYIKDILKED